LGHRYVGEEAVRRSFLLQEIVGAEGAKPEVDATTGGSLGDANAAPVASPEFPSRKSYSRVLLNGSFG
jgi:hypothetical protein